MNENEFELDGRIYVAVEHEAFNLCGNCAFRRRGELCESAPSCGRKYRKDNKNVIFMEKQQ